MKTLFPKEILIANNQYSIIFVMIKKGRKLNLIKK